MNYKDLEKAQKEIEASIIQFAQKKGLTNNSVEPILDGIGDAKAYCESPKKVMWILKEPYDDFDSDGKPVGGGWSISKALAENPNVEKQIFRRMMKITYGIYNNLRYDKVANLDFDSKLQDVLKSIAYVNVGKMPNTSETSDARLYELFNLWKNILIKQINTYKPEIIIFGFTFKCFEKYFFPNGTPKHDVISREGSDYIGLYKIGNMTLLDAYHPSCHYTDENYIDTILEAVE